MPQVSAKAPQTNQTPAPTIPAMPTATQFPVPQTQRDVNAYQATRDELGNQLNSARGRRDELSRQLPNSTPGPDRSGIEARITQLDARILTIESDLAGVGRALSNAPSNLRQTTSTGVPHPYGQPSSGQLTAISIIGIVFVLGPLAMAAARMALRRTAVPAAPQLPKEVVDRLERMEQGIDAVAVELERIGEGQRFVTQLMSDRATRAAIPESVKKT
jgi:hypothetical protein